MHFQFASSARLTVIWFCLLVGVLGLAGCERAAEPAAEAQVEAAPATEPATEAAPADESASASPSAVIAFEGARVIIGDGSPPIENAVFTVDGGRFVAVGPADKVDVPAGASRVDLSGKTVMPALVDAHVHMRTTRDELIEDLQRRAYWGVGAAVSMGSDVAGAPLELRDELIPGAARYRSAGLGITRPEPGRLEVHWVDTEEQARQAVREEAARGVDMIKIWVDDRNGKYEKLTPELYGAVIDEAHKHGLRVFAHIFTLEDAKGLLQAGVDVFAHGVRDRDIDDEFVKMVAWKPGLILIPNLPERGVATDLGWLSGYLPAAELEALQAKNVEDAQLQSTFDIQARNLARLYATRTTIAFGSDGNTPWAPHVEMADMVAAGMTPADVIVAATSNAAKAAGLQDETGTIAARKSADFLVLDADPLADITNTRKISDVYLRGERVDRDALAAGWMAVE